MQTGNSPTKTPIAPSQHAINSQNGETVGVPETMPLRKTPSGGSTSRTKKKQKLTEHQAKLLWRIGKSPLMVTKSADGADRYSLENGKSVNTRTAQRLISDGWVKPYDGGLFAGIAQTYVPAN